MAAVRIKPTKHANCKQYREHLRRRVDERTFVRSMAEELDVWLKTGPRAPDLDEASAGWHKTFGSFTILGEGECYKAWVTDLRAGQAQAE